MNRSSRAMIVGLDIGGANLKITTTDGWSRSVPFALWQRPHDLTATLTELLSEIPNEAHLAATMTGELCDCFAMQREGVRFIVESLTAAARGRRVSWYALDGTWLAPNAASEQPARVAAANWHALATFAGRWAPADSAIVVDIGSTTSDLIPLVAGRPTAQASNDTQRLVHGELVYTGVVRSPVCAVTSAVPWRGRRCQLAQELFATMWDVYLVLEKLPEEPDSRHTADGRPATRAHAHARLARAICSDCEHITWNDAVVMAEAIAAAQRELLLAAANQVTTAAGAPPATVLISGQGEFLAREIATQIAPGARIVSLNERLGAQLSTVAPAYAVAVLAEEV